MVLLPMANSKDVVRGPGVRVCPRDSIIDFPLEDELPFAQETADRASADREVRAVSAKGTDTRCLCFGARLRARARRGAPTPRAVISTFTDVTIGGIGGAQRKLPDDIPGDVGGAIVVVEPGRVVKMVKC